MEDGTFKFSLLSKYPEISHGVSGRVYGNMSLRRGDQGKVIQNREQFLSEIGGDISKLVVSENIHEAKITVVQAADKGKGAKSIEDHVTGSDGLLTEEKGLFLMTTVADCFPIFAYDPVEQIVGLAHAGWRGIIAGITTNLIHRMNELGSESNNILLGVGPGICQKHFVIKDEVLNAFLVAYPAAVLTRNKDGYVDLRKAILADLKRNNIPSGNIEISNVCPVCQNGKFGSHRAEGDFAPISAAVIGLRE